MPRSATAILEDSMRRNARHAAFLTVFAVVLAAGGLALDVYAIRNGGALVGFFGLLIAATGIAPLRAAAHLRGEDAALASLHAALRNSPAVEPALEALRAVASHTGRPPAATASAASLASVLQSGILDGSLSADGGSELDVGIELARSEPIEPERAESRVARGVWHAVWPVVHAVLARRRDEHGFAVPDRRDPHYAAWKQTLRALVSRVVLDGTGYVTVTVVSVAFLIGVLLFVTRGLPAPVLALEIALGIYALPLATVLAACVVLREQAPDRFARTVLDACSTPQTLRVIAYRILVRCAATAGRLRRLHELAEPDLLDSTEDDPDLLRLRWLPVLEEHGTRIERLVNDLRRQLPGEILETRRTEALLDGLAGRLATPRRRLGNRLFALDPAAFRQRWIEHVEGWDALTRTAQQGPRAVDRFVARMRDNARLLHEIDRCANEQRRLLVHAHRTVLVWICRRAAEPASDSVASYAHVLASMAAAGMRAIDSRRSAASTAADRDRDVRNAWTQVRALVCFLRRKARVLPGPDPHRTCKKACRDAARRAKSQDRGTQSNEWKTLRRALRAVGAGDDREHRNASPAELERDLDVLSRVDAELGRLASFPSDRVVDVQPIRGRRRKLFLSLGTDGERADEIRAAAGAAARASGFEVAEVTGTADLDTVRARVLACDAFVQVAVEPREPGKRIRSRLALERGIALGGGLPTCRMEVDPDEDDWEPLLRACIAELIEST